MSRILITRTIGRVISQNKRKTFPSSINTPRLYSMHRNATQTFRLAVMNELNSFRIIACIRGPEMSLPRGWDDGLDDDDGG